MSKRRPDLQKIIKYLKSISELPGSVKDLSGDECVALHDELHHLISVADIAARDLWRHTRHLNVPVDLEELRRTAYHEAGHAVADILQGFKFREVFLNEYFGMDSAGKVLTKLTKEQRHLYKWERTYSEELPSEDDRKELEKSLVSLLAGPEAERRFDGIYCDGDEFDPLWEMFLDKGVLCSDLSAVLKLAWSLRLAPPLRATSVNSLREKFPRYKEDWFYFEDEPPVHPLPAFFNHGLKSAELKFLDGFAKKTRAMLDANWDKVEIIAEALFERKRLTYKECLALVAEAVFRRPERQTIGNNSPE